MKTALRDESLSQYSAIAVVISSHGNEDGYLHDKDLSVRINTKEIFDALEANRGTLGKPKIVIIDACRGSGEQTGIVVRNSDAIVYHHKALLNLTTLFRHLQCQTLPKQNRFEASAQHAKWCSLLRQTTTSCMLPPRRQRVMSTDYLGKLSPYLT